MATQQLGPQRAQESETSLFESWLCPLPSYLNLSFLSYYIGVKEYLPQMVVDWIKCMQKRVRGT